MPEEQLMAIAAAVADGLPLDWAAAEQSAQSDADRNLIRELRYISALSGLTRTLSDEGPALVGDESLVTSSAAQFLPQWGQFALIERLGAGAQGEVFRALDLRLQRDVALKLRHKAAISSADQEAFLSEARLLARLRHPNVVTIHGADVVDRRVGLWMELIQGETLDLIVAQSGKFGGQEATLVGVSLCGALSAVHSAGLLHRDIKAQNVMRESGGRYVLMDFGVGRDIEGQGPGAGAGTPLYLAPEILNGEPASVQSEIYSLGVLLYFLVTGSYPYQAASIAGLLEAQRQPHPSLAHRRQDLPVAFSRAVERALSRSPSERFASSGDFADALAAALPQAPGHQSPRGGRRWLLAIGAVLTLAAAGFAWMWMTRPFAVAPAGTVAVLPFQDLSRDQSAEYLARGLADLLTTSLGARTDLRVLARTTTQEFIGNQRPLELAREVGADRLIEGSVLPERDRVRVSLRVVHAGSGSTLWAGELVGALNSLGALEEEMVRTISSNLGKQLSPTDHHGRWQADAASMEDYFRGWGEYWRQSREGFREAQRLFQSALTRSPSFAEAHAAYAYARLTDELSNREATYEEGVRRARDSAATALRLDPRSALAEATIGWGKFYVEWDWRGAEQHLQRAIAMNPSDPQIRWMYGQLLMAENRLGSALAEARLARRLDPLNPARHAHVATVLYYDRRFEEARQEVSNVLTRDPNAPYARFGLSRMLSALGRHDEALTWIRTASHLNEPFVLAELARQLLVTGRTDEARPLLKTLESDYHSGRLAPDYFAFVRLAQGDTEAAMALIDEAVRVRSGTVVWILVDPRFDGLRQDVRFVDALRDIGLARALP